MTEAARAGISAHATAEAWFVVVLYQNKITRDRAMALCDRLVKNFWADVEFDFRWWRLDFLDDPRMAQIAAGDATTADIFILSSTPDTEISMPALKWFETWSAQRERREGLFLDLTDAASQNLATVQRRQALLRALASRANLDYWNRIPPPLSGSLLQSWPSVEARATEVTSVLNDILNRLPPPPHFGLNE